ncbi:MAG: DUF952 domain-containing protein [Caldilineales bacterium]|nr:DUF952 domain-containing protein [Caldilineales bacterium]
MIYHITFVEAWQDAEVRGVYLHDSLESEGFIHCSTTDQLVATANRFFAGADALLVLAIAPANLEAELLYEESEPGQWFPHIYGPLNLGAVVGTFTWQLDVDGRFATPAYLQNIEDD